MCPHKPPARPLRRPIAKPPRWSRAPSSGAGRCCKHLLIFEGTGGSLPAQLLLEDIS